jgi:hypothetical protein
MPFSLRSAPLAALVAAALLALTAQAQTLEGKAPATGKVMSFSELKACIVQQEELKVRRTNLEAQRAQLDGERTTIEQETAAIKADREVLVKRNEQIRAFNDKMKAFAERVEAHRQRSEEMKDGSLTGRNLERRQRELAKEQQALEAEDKQLKDEGETLTGSAMDDFVKKMNARADAQQQRASGWNDRSKKLDEANVTYEDNRLDWRANCGDRRFREDDEKLIRSDLAKGVK